MEQLVSAEMSHSVRCLLFVRRGDPVGVFCSLLGVTQDGLSGVAVIRFIQSDIFHNE